MKTEIIEVWKDDRIRDLEHQLAEKDERIAELEREVEELKANQTPTRKRLLPKNWDKYNLADKLRYKEKQVHLARVRLQEKQEMIDELDYELNKYKSLYTENEEKVRHYVCEEIRGYIKNLIEIKDLSLCNWKYANGWCQALQYNMAEILSEVEKGEKE